MRKTGCSTSLLGMKRLISFIIVRTSLLNLRQPPWRHPADSEATISVSLRSVRSRLRHSEERHGHRCHVRDAAGAHHEVHHPRGHGWHHRHLRAGGGCADSKQHL